jgi:hypothetical protein
MVAAPGARLRSGPPYAKIIRHCVHVLEAAGVSE